MADGASVDRSGPPAGKKSKKEKRREKRAQLGPSDPTHSSLSTKRQRGETHDGQKPSKRAKPPDEAARQAAAEAAAAGRRIFVGHIPQGASEASIRAAFIKCGAISEVDRMLRSSGRFRGSAFITFQAAKGAKAAARLAGPSIEGKVVTVEMSKSSSTNAAPSNSNSAPNAANSDGRSPTTSIFVAGLPSTINKKTLRAIFRSCGDIRRVRLLEPTQDDEGRGFVDFGNLTASAEALAKDGEEYEGCRIVVQYSRKQAPGGRVRRSQEARARRRRARDVLRT